MNNSIKAIIGFVVVFFILVISAFGSYFQVDQGERGVLLRNGKVVSVSEPGLSWKTPFIDSVKFISVRDYTVLLPMEAYSYDQQPASIKVSVTYRIPADKVKSLYSEYGTIGNMQARIIERRTPDAVKNVFGRFTAERSIKERQNLGIEMNELVRQQVAGAPVEIVSVQVEEVQFSETYEKSIEQRMLAQVQIETTRQQKETAVVQAEIAVVQAKATADAQREQFAAVSDGIRMKGQAEAEAIEARAKALASNSALTNMMAVEKWDGKLPGTFVPGSALPFIGVK